MSTKAEYDISIKLIHFFLSLAGFGLPKTKIHRRFMDSCMAMCFSLIYLAAFLCSLDIYYCFKEGNMLDTTYAILITLVTVLTGTKLTLAGLQRAHYEKILLIAQDHLWTKYQTEYGKKIIENCVYQARWFFLLFLMLSHATGATFIVEPIMLNIQSNSSVRYLPYRVRLDLPVYETPYYEMWLGMSTVGTWVAVILYASFDYYSLLLNIFIVGHFRILKKRFKRIYLESQQHLGTTAVNEDINMKIILGEFKSCVKQHQFLIWLVGEVESIHKFMNLTTVLIFSFILCLLAYQCLLPGTIAMYFKFSSFIFGCTFQLATFSLSCHNIMAASIDIAHGTYESPWYLRNGSKSGRAMTRNIVIVMMKTKSPCYLTAGGFFVITLETFKSTCSTAISYFLLIRQSMEKV